jgi:hypothetical protein
MASSRTSQNSEYVVDLVEQLRGALPLLNGPYSHATPLEVLRRLEDEKPSAVTGKSRAQHEELLRRIKHSTPQCQFLQLANTCVQWALSHLEDPPLADKPPSQSTAVSSRSGRGSSSKKSKPRADTLQLSSRGLPVLVEIIRWCLVRVQLVLPLSRLVEPEAAADIRPLLTAAGTGELRAGNIAH